MLSNMKYALLILIVLASCAGSHMQSVTSEEQFVNDMIPHHQEAVDNSRLVLVSTQDPQIKDLAERIITAQEGEIARMQEWQRAWYNSSTHSSSYRHMMGEQVHAADRDRAYLEGMILHHKAAIDMANAVLKLNLRPEVATLAQNIIATQQAEIEEMKALLQ
jgi:uncharacterized protein (DUF305 family)